MTNKPNLMRHALIHLDFFGPLCGLRSHVSTVMCFDPTESVHSRCQDNYKSLTKPKLLEYSN